MVKQYKSLSCTAIAANQYIGDFEYCGETFRFVTTDSLALRRLRHNRGANSVKKALQSLTVFKVIDDTIVFNECSQIRAAELALKIGQGF